VLVLAAGCGMRWTSSARLAHVSSASATGLTFSGGASLWLRQTPQRIEVSIGAGGKCRRRLFAITGHYA